ncbi:HAD hydrolase-like protein [Christensenellaceae bacterium OttesenSCG-928-K19]|nr:HAD hydrolase-like protein [Christensenellaceae bacterium OttesenSCG-928-K19]
MRYKTVLFDFDGTIMDSGKGIIRCAVETAQHFGLEPPGEAQLRKFVGPPIVLSFVDTFGVSREQAEKMVLHYREVHRSSNAKLEGSVYAGIEELLERLNEAGATCAVASVKNRVTVQETVEHFGLEKHFKAVCGGDGVTMPDKAVIVRECLQKLHVSDKSSTILVGDSDYDAIGAGQVGIDFCAVLWGYGFSVEADVKKFDCKSIAHDVQELGRFLLG